MGCGYEAITAKCRSRMALLLTPEDYEALASASDFAGLAAELRKNELYALPFSRDTIATRGEYEEALFSSYIGDYIRFYRFTQGGQREFFRLLIRKFEVASILRAARLLCGGLFEEREAEEFRVSPFLRELSDVDFKALFSAPDISSFVASLEKTSFSPALASVNFGEGNPDCDLLETALYTEYYRGVLAGAPLVGSEGEREFVDAVSCFAELSNITRILRTRRLALRVPGGDPAAALKYLLPIRARLKSGDETRLLTLPEDEVISLLSGAYPECFPEDMKNSADELRRQAPVLARYKCRRGKKLAHLPRPTLAVAYGYLLLRSTENRNLITVGEGLRYGLPRSALTSRLIL